jgi:hypothetical protein
MELGQGIVKMQFVWSHPSNDLIARGSFSRRHQFNPTALVLGSLNSVC